MTQEMRTPRTSYVYIQEYNDGLQHILDFERLAQSSGERLVLALDVETSGLSPHVERLLFVQLYHKACAPLILDVRRLGVENTATLLKGLLESERWLKVGHNLKFDGQFIKAHLGLSINRLFDTYLAEELLVAGLGQRTSLAELSLKYFDKYMHKDVRNRFIGMGDEPVDDELLRYMASDVDLLPRLMNIQKRLLKSRGLVDVAKLEFALLPVLIDAELHGVKIDRARWEKHIVNLDRKAKALEAELCEELQPYIDAYREGKQRDAARAYAIEYADYANRASQREAAATHYKERMLNSGMGKGEAQKALNAWKKDNPPIKKPVAPKLGCGPINLNSPQQLQGALSMMGVKLPLKENGQMETDRLSLQWVQSEYPILGKILEYRGLSKLVTAFGEAVMKFLDEDGRLHPEYRQLVSTGRMSCSKPNIQQVPANELGAEFRQCFVAPPGYKIISADYSQIELRILYELAGQEEAIEAINGGMDLHSLTAARMFNLDYEYVKDNYSKIQHLKDKRRAAKAINFGIAYGLSPQGLSRNEKIPLKDAKKYVSSYFQSNPRVAEWLDRTGQNGMANRYAETMLGRKRFLPSLDKLDPQEARMKRGGQVRAVTNHPIQGTSADITKMAAVKISRALRKSGYDAALIMFVHDEIVVEARAEQADAVAELVTKQMKDAAEFFLQRVAVEVGCSIADHWEH
jgi:DNA polymerase I